MENGLEEKKKPEEGEEEGAKVPTEAPEAEGQAEGNPGEVKQPAEGEAGPEGEALPEEDTRGEGSEGSAGRQPRMLTEDEVNRIVSKRVNEARRKGYEQARQELFLKYGVESDDELEGLFRDGTRYGELSKRLNESSQREKSLSTRLALLRSGVLPEREEDVIAILGAKGLDVTEENIAALLPSHMEWRAQAMESEEVPPKSPGQRQTVPMRPMFGRKGGSAYPSEGEPETEGGSLGVEPNPLGRAPGMTDEERAFKLAGLNYKK